MSLQQTNFKNVKDPIDENVIKIISIVTICHVNVFLFLLEKVEDICTIEKCNNAKPGVQNEANETRAPGAC